MTNVTLQRERISQKNPSKLQRNHTCYFCGEVFPKSSSRFHVRIIHQQRFHEKSSLYEKMLSRKSLLHQGIQLPRNTDLSKDKFDFA